MSKMTPEHIHGSFNVAQWKDHFDEWCAKHPAPEGLREAIAEGLMLGTTYGTNHLDGGVA